MSDVIKLLPDSVANQIAAGEVIQRPASVIKELVENAVDAGATEIRIYLKDAGRTLIHVIDNGCGMSTVDARMAFERHATSKITHADDLFRLHTMGFRGEALPSICAIAQVEVKSRTKDSEMGTLLQINGSKVERQEPCVCDTGTSIAVRNIFFNVPARRKFLKSDNVELSNIMREFERLALVNNNIHMSIDTGTRQLDLRRASLHQRIHDIWKNNLKMELLPVEIDTALVRVSGYISRPEFARRRNALQFLIVNGRNMRHPYFHKAILSCYDGLIATDTQPCYFLKFEVDPASIDVNIHPTKNEIKFEYESEIWPLLVAGVKASLGKNAAVPSIDFNAEVVPVSPVNRGEIPDRPTMELPADYNPFDAYGAPGEPADSFSPDFSGYNPGFGSTAGFEPSASESGRAGRGNPTFRSGAATRDWEKLYSDFIGQRIDSHAEGDAAAPENDALLPGMEAPERPANMCVQFALKYIISTTREGIIIVDQHRAHLKLLFEQFMQIGRQSRGVTQRVMFPESLTLEPMQQSALQEVEGDLKRLGYELEYAEEDRWNIVGIPADLNANPRDVILRVLDSVSEDSVDYGEDQQPADAMLSRVALAMARSAAITRGRRLSEEEMENLIGELFALPDPALTPTGRRIYTLLDEAAVSRLLP